MTTRPLVKQTIAKDQNEVAEKLDLLLVQNNIERDSILDIEITKFGANQFLILAIYYGIYLFWCTAGLVASADRDLAMKRAEKEDIGLTTSNARELAMKRAAIDDLGLIATAIARALASTRLLSPGLGLVTSVAEEWLNHSPVYTAGLGLVASEDRDLATGRATIDDIGLACDVSYTHYHP